MKKKFKKPTLEICEFAVAARLMVSGGGTAHSNSAKNSACTMKASNSSDACAPPSVMNSDISNAAC